MTASEKSYYQILQVEPTADQDVIEAAYRQLARQYHPDLNHSLEATRHMQEINRAYEVLSNPARRLKYDREYLQLNSHFQEQKDPQAVEQPHKEVAVNKALQAELRRLEEERRRAELRIRAELRRQEAERLHAERAMQERIRREERRRR